MNFQSAYDGANKLKYIYYFFGAYIRKHKNKRKEVKEEVSFKN